MVVWHIIVVRVAKKVDVAKHTHCMGFLLTLLPPRFKNPSYMPLIS